MYYQKLYSNKYEYTSANLTHSSNIQPYSLDHDGYPSNPTNTKQNNAVTTTIKTITITDGINNSRYTNNEDNVNNKNQYALIFNLSSDSITTVIPQHNLHNTLPCNCRSRTTCLPQTNCRRSNVDYNYTVLNTLHNFATIYIGSSINFNQRYAAQFISFR